MFEEPVISFLLILAITGFIGFGISMFSYSGSLLKRILLAPVVGYAVISLLTAYLSYAGFGIDQVALRLFLGLMVVSITVLILNKKNIHRINRLSLRFLILVVVFGLFNAAIILAPMILENVVYLFNDHATYISISEFLRESGYLEPTYREVEFWQDNTWQYQSMHLRMGAQFFVAFFAGLSGTVNTMFIYPSLLGFVAFILMSSFGFFYLSLRDKKANLIELSFVLFFSLIAINLNIQNIVLGFLPQTGGLILMVILFALAYETFYLKKSHYVLTALLFAAMVLTYHEITLFYGAGIFMLILFEFFYRKNRDMKFFAKVLGAHLGALVFSPIATKEFILGIQSSAGSNLVGWNVPFSFLRYFQMMFGQDMHYLIPNGSYRYAIMPGLFATFFYAYLFCRGKLRDERKHITQFLLVSFTPFIVGIGLFAYLVYNPFNGQLGHTWRIFKLVGWSYWVIPIVIGMMAYTYFKESKIKKIFVLITMLVFLPSLIGNIHANYNNHKYEMELYTGNYEDLYEDFKYLADNRADYSPANIIPYLSHPNYSYLTLSILQDTSSGDLNIFGYQLVPSLDNEFYTWINHRREHDNTQEALITKAGYNIYPQDTSTVYLFDGFSQREIYDDNHLAWLTTNSGTMKVVVPEEGKAQFTTSISNWQAQQARVEILLDGVVIFTSNINQDPVVFTSPVMTGGNALFTVKYYGTLRTPDASDGRTLGLMFKDTNIQPME